LNIDVSDKAQKELMSIMKEPESFLRIKVVSGGCAGMSYSPGIDTVISDEDVVLFEDSGLKVIADMKSALFLGGLTIDYSDDLMNAGFRFSNPSAKKACGCGQSFEA
jgi:iron-sulfur cluster assembly protein